MYRILLLFLSLSLFGNEMHFDYQAMNKEMFENKVVGHTIVGITRQSHSLYMLYFTPEGTCELWKGGFIYAGECWIDNESDQFFVHAFWPQYVSSEPNSLFCLQNALYGKPTSLRYYVHVQTGALLVAGKKFVAPVILAPGRAFSK